RSAFSSLRSNPVARASAASSGSSLSQRSIHPRRLFGGAVSGGNELSNSSSRSRRSLRVTDSLARPNRRANQRPITSNPRPDYPRIVPHSPQLFGHAIAQQKQTAPRGCPMFHLEDDAARERDLRGDGAAGGYGTAPADEGIAVGESLDRTGARGRDVRGMPKFPYQGCNLVDFVP